MLILLLDNKIASKQPKFRTDCTRQRPSK